MANHQKPTPEELEEKMKVSMQELEKEDQEPKDTPEEPENEPEKPETETPEEPEGQDEKQFGDHFSSRPGHQPGETRSAGMDR